MTRESCISFCLLFFWSTLQSFSTLMVNKWHLKNVCLWGRRQEVFLKALPLLFSCLVKQQIQSLFRSLCRIPNRLVFIAKSLRLCLRSFFGFLIFVWSMMKYDPYFHKSFFQSCNSVSFNCRWGNPYILLQLINMVF